MSYLRVVPRDLFNESKLLKCLGTISVRILDGHLGAYNIEDELEGERDGFVIVQNDDDGSISCLNYHVRAHLGTTGQIALNLFTLLNSKSPYPLICESAIDQGHIEVFTDNGAFTKEFLHYLELLRDYQE